MFHSKMVAFDSKEIETVLDKNKTLPASPLSQKHVSSSSPKVRQMNLNQIELGLHRIALLHVFIAKVRM